MFISVPETAVKTASGKNFGLLYLRSVSSFGCQENYSVREARVPGVEHILKNEALSNFLLASFVLDGFAEFRFRCKTFFLMLMMTRVMGVERRVRGDKTP